MYWDEVGVGERYVSTTCNRIRHEANEIRKQFKNKTMHTETQQLEQRHLKVSTSEFGI